MAKPKKIQLNDKDNTWSGTNGNDKVFGNGGDDVLSGGNGNDKLDGGAGDDILNGGNGNDKLVGGDGNDQLNGGKGNDKLNASVGDDGVNGGADEDTVILGGNYADAVITQIAGGWQIVHAGGTATIKNVEKFQFADQTVDEADLAPTVQPGVTRALTALDGDVISDLTVSNDTITGAAGTLNAKDIILDNSSTDADVLNVTLTAKNGAATISGIETINATWDSFAAAEFDATNVTGANINLTSSKLGFLGAATVTGAGKNTVTAGAGMTGALTVNGVTGAKIDATNSSSVVAQGSDALTDTVTINAGASVASIAVGAVKAIETVTVNGGTATKTVSVTNYNTATIDAAAATTINLLDDAATDSATVKVGSDAAVNIGASTGKLALDIADGKTVTLDAIGADLTVTGAGSVTVKSAGFSGETIVDNTAGSLTLVTTVANNDFSKADADLFVLTAAGANTATFLSGDKVRVDVDAAGSNLSLGLGGIAGTSDSLTATFTKSQTGAVTFTNAETVNLIAAGAAVAGDDLTFTTVTVTPSATATGTLKISGTNDVKIATAAASAVDASGLTGNLTIQAVSGAAVSIIGASGINDVNLDASTGSAAFIGQNGADVVAFGTLAAGETATAVTAGGNDKVSVNAAALLTGAGAVSIETGDGDDTVTLTTATATTGTIVVQGGAGTDTLDVGTSDLSKANLTLTGFEKITVGATATFSAATLSGQAYAITGTGTSVVTVDGTTGADTINLGSLVVSDSASTGVKFTVNGGDGNDTIVGSAVADTITGGQGVDVLTGGAFGDTFVFAGGDTGTTVATADTITDYTKGVDTIDVSANSVVAANGAGAADFTALVALADASLAATGDVYIAYNALGTGNAYVFVDHGGVAGSFDAGDTLIILNGINDATKIDVADFI